MVRLLASIIGVGVETADMLVQEVLSRNLRDRRAVARYAGLTGSPDESGSKRREKGLAKAGNARVRRGLIQLAWRFLMFQKDSALAQWYRAPDRGAEGARKTTMIVALARKLLIALWRMVTTGEIPKGIVMTASGLTTVGRGKTEMQLRRPLARFRAGPLKTIRGGGDPSRSMAATPSRRMGPPPRSLAAEANDCFMVRTPPGPTEYKVVARCLAPNGGLPSDHRAGQPSDC